MLTKTSAEYGKIRENIDKKLEGLDPNSEEYLQKEKQIVCSLRKNMPQSQWNVIWCKTKFMLKMGSKKKWKTIEKESTLSKIPLPLCACGCGKTVSNHNNRFCSGHHLKKLKNKSELPFCQCGCGLRVKALKSKYRKGHLFKDPRNKQMVINHLKSIRPSPTKGGRRSRFYENLKAEELKPSFSNMYLPQEICDRICIRNNSILFIEIKHKGENLRPKQKEFRDLCNRLGYVYNIEYI